MKMLDKNANITIAILVIGILLVSCLTIASFFMSKIKVGGSFDDILSVEKMNSQIEDYLVHHNLKNVDTIEKGNKIIFHQERKASSGFLLWKSEKVAFTAEYLLQ